MEKYERKSEYTKSKNIESKGKRREVADKIVEKEKRGWEEKPKWGRKLY